MVATEPQHVDVTFWQQNPGVPFFFFSHLDDFFCCLRCLPRIPPQPDHGSVYDIYVDVFAAASGELMPGWLVGNGVGQVLTIRRLVSHWKWLPGNGSLPFDWLLSVAELDMVVSALSCSG